MKRVFDGLIIGPKRMFGNSGYIKGAWLLLARHYPWSITWSWAIYWNAKPPLCGWCRYVTDGRCGFSIRKQDALIYPNLRGKNENV